MHKARSRRLRVPLDPFSTRHDVCGCTDARHIIKHVADWIKDLGCAAAQEGVHTWPFDGSADLSRQALRADQCREQTADASMKLNCGVRGVGNDVSVHRLCESVAPNVATLALTCVELSAPACLGSIAFGSALDRALLQANSNCIKANTARLHCSTAAATIIPNTATGCSTTGQ